MTNVQIIYASLQEQHRRIGNEISEIKASNYDLSDEDKKKVSELERKQVQLMHQMKMLFNGNFGK